MRAGNFLSPEFTSPQVCIPSNAHARYDESQGTTNNKKTNIKNLKKPYSRECCAMFLQYTTQKPTHFSLSNDMQQPQIHKKSPKVPLWSSRFHICVSQYVLASARRVRYSVRSRTSFLLPPVFRSTICLLYTSPSPRD